MSIIKSGIIIGFFTFLSRIFGFIRDIFITKELGASIYSDAFNIAFRLPNLFRRLFAEGAFNSAFVPIFTNKFKNDKDQALNFAGDAFTMLTVALVIITIICEIFIEELVYIIAPGFALNDINSLELTVALSRIALPYLLFISISSLFSSMLNSTHRFMIASIIPILLNVAMIISLLFFGDITKSKAHALIWGVFFGGILQVFVAFIGVRRAGLMPKVSKFQLSDDLKKLLKNMVPGIIGGGITQINLIVSQALASFLPVGGLSILAYSDRVCQLPLAVIGTAIGTVILPTLSRQLHAKEYVLANETQNRAVEAGFLLAMPAMIALVIMAKPIVFALFERGAFSHQDTILTANCLIAFSLGLIGYIMIKIFTPVFFAIYDTKTPVKISLISIIINFVIHHQYKWCSSCYAFVSLLFLLFFFYFFFI